MGYFNERFKIHSLEINDGFLKGIKINFDNMREERSDEVFTSIVIGENGVGKSEILSILVDIFLELENYIKGRKIKSSSRRIRNYKIKYEIEGNTYEVEKNRGRFHINENDYNIISNLRVIDEKIIKLPRRILACSFLVNDKFIFVKDKEEKNESIYKYLGVRASRTHTNTATIIKRIANNIIVSKGNDKFIKGLSIAFRFLNLSEEFSIMYRVKQRELFFSGDVTVQNIVSKFEKELWGKRSTDAYGKKILEELKKDSKSLDRIVNLINDISKKLEDRNKITYKINLNSNVGQTNEFDFNEIEMLIALDLISNPEIFLNKKGKYSLEKGSSGELHILFLITNILSNIESNSVILIDEPEISLHPNWQIKIITLLKKVLQPYCNKCHIIVATHSHFMVSDLNGSSSSLSVLENRNGIIESKEIVEETYGWSAENILLNVFGVPTNRNYYLAKELDNILRAITVGDIRSVRDKKDYLLNISQRLNDIDPLKEVIIKILDKVNNYE